MDKEHLSSIIENCKNGDKQSFKLLMLDLTDYVFALAFRILANEEDAQDVLQETFIKVWKNIEKYRSEIKITTWIYTIATNLCLDRIRTNRRKALIFSPDFEKTFNTLVSDNLSDNFDNNQLAEIIAHLAENLTPKQKIVFVLKDLEGFESEEIEQITGLDKGQIKSNLYYARQQIKNKLIQKGYEVR